MKANLRRRSRFLSRAGATGLLLSLLPLGPLHAAEKCATAPSEFELLREMGDESGIGGTGHSPADPEERLTQISPSRPGDDSESGIGGTGRESDVRGDDESGIGGTGIYGSVRRSDQICIGGVEVYVPGHLTLESSTSPSTQSTASMPRALSTGHVAFVLARETENGLIAERIFLDPPFVGQIEKVSPDRSELIISGQRVRLPVDFASVAPDPRRALRKGAWIAYSGLPDPSKRIVASRVDPLDSLNPGDSARVPTPHPTRQAPRPEWIALTEHLNYFSVEGYVSGTARSPHVSGFRVSGPDSSPPEITREFRSGARVRIGGRIQQTSSGPVLQLMSPPRPRLVHPFGHPETSTPPSAERPEDTRPPTKAKPSRPQDVPERPRDIRPEIRPDTRPDRVKIQRPAELIRPEIDARSTR